MNTLITMLSKFWNKKWKYVVKKPDANNEMKEQFIFIHIPKTAGTTFRFILYNHFKSKDIYPTQKDLRKNSGGYLNTTEFLKQQKYENRSMLIGHFPYSITNRINNEKVKKMAFFRNPLDIILSRIKHIKTYDEVFMNSDVNVILEKNWQAIMHRQSNSMGFDIEKKNMPRVRQNIISLDFIGITEYFEESIQLCNATFNWKLENIEPRNVLEEQIFGKLTARSKMKISQGLGPELRTYNIALNHFRARCKKYKIELVD